MDSRTPENVVGACSRVTDNTDPGRSLSGCLLANHVSSHFCFIGFERLFCKYAIMPFPLRRASIWEVGTGGGDGSMTVFEKGYDAVLVDNCLTKALHEFLNMVAVESVDISNVTGKTLAFSLSNPKIPSTSANNHNRLSLWIQSR